jgi:hypothetical protein
MSATLSPSSTQEGLLFAVTLFGILVSSSSGRRGNTFNAYLLLALTFRILGRYL